MTGSIQTAQRQDGAFVGAVLRGSRRGRNCTLGELRERADLSVGYLGQIERDIATPSLSSLRRLAAALSMDLEDFMQMPGARGLVSRADERETTWVRRGGMIYQRLHGEFPGASFSAFLISLPPGFLTETDQHFGEEFLEVRAGSVLFEIDGTDYALETGDTLHFRSDMRQQARSTGAEEALIFWLGNGPTFRQRPDLSPHASP